MNYTGSLFASLIWGTVGMGFFIYGKRQGAATPLFGGLAMIAISYFISSPLYLTLVSIAIICGIVWLTRQGY